MEKKYIAVTFDDGPNTSTTVEVLDVLKRYNTVGTFFLVGNNISEQSAQSVKRAVDMGCEICNHSKTHSVMTDMSAEDIAAEIRFTSDKAKEIAGYYPKFFRPPYIAVNDVMHNAIDIPFISGFGCTDWDDSVEPAQRFEKIMEQASHGGIILLHDMEGNDKTVAALDMIIPALQEMGYEFVTVSKLFELCGITPQKGIVYSNVYQTTPF